MDKGKNTKKKPQNDNLLCNNINHFNELPYLDGVLINRYRR